MFKKIATLTARLPACPPAGYPTSNWANPPVPSYGLAMLYLAEEAPVQPAKLPFDAASPGTPAAPAEASQLWIAGWGVTDTFDAKVVT